jgi:uncharacterized membrane protein
MTKTTPDPPLFRHFKHHPTLFLGLAVAIVVGAAMTRLTAAGHALLFGWCAGVLVYLGLAIRLAMTATTATMRKRAKSFDVSTGFISAVTILAAVISISAITIDLVQVNESHQPAFAIVLAATTLVLSWLFLQTAFTVHYAHLYYQNPDILCFPGTREPDYWDFFYFSSVIGMTAQVSDVTTGAPGIRRLVTVHGVISFFFNTAILALGVNLTAGLVE